MFLTLEELELVFLNGILSEHGAAKIGPWELCGFLILVCFIVGDLFAYHFYSHKKIIISNNKGKFYRLVAFLAKDPKIYRSTLKFVGFGIFCFLILVELLLDGKSDLLDLIKEFIRIKS
jgi:hypothetical protein